MKFNFPLSMLAALDQKSFKSCYFFLVNGSTLLNNAFGAETQHFTNSKVHFMPRPRLCILIQFVI